MCFNCDRIGDYLYTYIYYVFLTQPLPISSISATNPVRFFTHLFFNYRNILNTKIPTQPKRQVYVIRQEHLWDDWAKVNKMFGQKEPVVVPSIESLNQRNISGLMLPVTRTISEQGRRKLCKALESEYAAYFQILQKAENINDYDLEDARSIVSYNCPSLPLLW